MTAKIKLNAASGGGSVSIQAPSSSSNNRVFTIPDEADATLLTSNTSTGKALQYKQTSFTANETTTSTSFVTTSLSVDITVTTGNKVFIMLTSGWWSGASDQLFLQIRRDSTVLLPYTGPSGATLTAGANAMLNGSVGTRAKESWNINVLDTHGQSTGTTLTYAVYWKVNSGTATLGKWGLNSDFGNISTITAIEVLD